MAAKKRAAKRKRSKSGSRPKLLLRSSGDGRHAVDGYGKGETKRVSMRIKPLLAKFGAAEAADEKRLARGLQSHLSFFLKDGQNAEMIRPLLQAFGEWIQKQHEMNLSVALAWIAVAVVMNEITVEEAAKRAMAARGEQAAWSDEDHLRSEIVTAKRAAPRGPKGSMHHEQAAARVYSLLAEGSRASVRPMRLDTRPGRKNPLGALLKEAFEDRLQENELNRTRRNERKESAR